MKKFFSIFLIVFFMACSEDGTPFKVADPLFDSSVEPITDGMWYKPDLNTTWQWQLSGTLNANYTVDLYDVDLFDTSVTDIITLKLGGKKVICYFSAGSYENWREDAIDFPYAVKDENLDGWIGEKWLDISNESLAPIMKARLDLAVQKGCDGVEPDNIDGYVNNSGFALSSDNQLAYNKFIANEARQRGLSIGLKNDLDQIIELEPYYDFAVNEQCFEFSECDKLSPFTDANKSVFNAEYAQKYRDNTLGARNIMCSESISIHFQTLILDLKLDDTYRDDCK